MHPIAVDVPDAPLTLLPAGCIHWPIGDKDLLKAWVEELRLTPNAKTILMGDSLDAARTHYRKHLKAYQEDQNSALALDEWHRREVADLARVLKPIREKILGIILGNHYWEYSDGINSEQYLAHLLGTRYFGPVGVVRLDFRARNQKRNKVSPRGAFKMNIVVWAHHDGGCPGGRTVGGDVNALVKQEGTFDADVYLLSHTHRRLSVIETGLEINHRGTPKILERERAFVRTGAFLKGYPQDFPSPTQPHFPTYAEKKALRPTNLGWVKLVISPKYRHDVELVRPAYDLHTSTRHTGG